MNGRFESVPQLPQDYCDPKGTSFQYQLCNMFNFLHVIKEWESGSHLLYWESLASNIIGYTVGTRDRICFFSLSEFWDSILK
jgi:hypothetical protein